jgi:hypothetical protein
VTTGTLPRHRTHSPAVAAAAHFGLAARACIYLVIGWIAIQIAMGHTREQANQKGAIATVARQHGGSVLLWILAFGLTAYALWRLSEAAFGTAVDGRKAGPRLQSLVRGVVYGGIAISAFLFVAGARGSGQDQQQESATAHVMKHSYGRLLIGIVGAVVVVVGIGMIAEGARRTFTKKLRMNDMSGPTRTAVIRIGTIGNIARGAVFALAGVLTIDAAMKYEPSKSTGLDGALRTLANRPFGPVLLGIAGIGLIAFGLYGLAAARWAKT